MIVLTPASDKCTNKCVHHFVSSVSLAHCYSANPVIFSPAHLHMYCVQPAQGWQGRKRCQMEATQYNSKHVVIRHSCLGFGSPHWLKKGNIQEHSIEDHSTITNCDSED